MTVNSSALQAVEWCNPSTSCYGFCRSIAIIASGDGCHRCVCVCYLAQVLICPIQILFAIVAIRGNLWVPIQCICRFACFFCDWRIHGTWCVYQPVGRLPSCQSIWKLTSFGSTIQCVVTIIAFMAEVVGMSVGSGFPVLSSRGWVVKYM